MTRDTRDELPAQQALRARPESLPAAMAERYRKLFEFAPVGIVYSNAEGYYLDANECISRMLGYARDELIGLHARDIIATDLIPCIQGALDEINSQVADYQRQWRFRRKDGSVFDADVSVTKFADGTLLGMIRDITRQLEHEREIDRLTRLYDALSQINQAIVWTTERDELLHKVCQVLVERGGFRMAWIGWHDAAGRRLVPLARFGDDNDYAGRITVHTDDRPEARGPSGTAFRTGKPYVSNDLLQDPATGSWRPELKRSGFLASASFPIRLAGEVCGTLNVYAVQRDVFHDKEVALLEEAATDISFALDNSAREEARLQAELTLRHEKQFSDMMMESMPGMVYLYDVGGKLLRWNQNFEKVLGYSAAELRQLNPLDLVPPEDRTATAARIAKLQAAGRGSGEVRIQTKDGKIIPYFFSRQLVLYNGQECLTGVGIDLSALKALEEQLRQSQKMEAIGQLAGGIAHDFNNLLTVIGSYSALLMSLPDLGGQVHDAARAIGEAGERAAALTRQLLGFSRRTMLQPRVLDLNAHVAETGSMLRRLIGEDVLIATMLAPDLGRIKVDPAQLDQVLMNLAVNARDAMPRGGRLTIETANFLITEEYAATHVDCKAGAHVMLALTDTGCGIPAEVMPRIFDPFFTTKESGKGTGLGLATVLGIVQQSGGRILCYSEPGRGTTFKIYFPAVTGDVVDTSEAAATPEVTGSETILLVEDDESVREVALLSLEMHGFHVITAKDGKDALRVAAEYQGSLDLLLTDVVMPNLSGADLAKTLCRQFPKLKVLFMSGYTNDAAVRHGLLDASVAFIQKPYTPQGLARKVRAVLDEQTLGGS